MHNAVYKCTCGAGYGPRLCYALKDTICIHTIHRYRVMPPTRRTMLISIKSRLIGARSDVQDAAARASRAGETALGNRLRDMAERLAIELDFVEGQIARLP